MESAQQHPPGGAAAAAVASSQGTAKIFNRSSEAVASSIIDSLQLDMASGATGLTRLLNSQQMKSKLAPVTTTAASSANKITPLPSFAPVQSMAKVTKDTKKVFGMGPSHHIRLQDTGRMSG